MNNKLPSFLQPFLPSFNLKKLDISHKETQRLITESILNEGDTRSVIWLLKNIPKNLIFRFLLQPSRGSWSKQSLNYWWRIFDIKSSQKKFDYATTGV